MTLKQAAEALGLDPASLRQAIARGALKATKLGRDWIVAPKEVERYRRENRREQTRAALDANREFDREMAEEGIRTGAAID